MNLQSQVQLPVTSRPSIFKGNFLLTLDNSNNQKDKSNLFNQKITILNPNIKNFKIKQDKKKLNIVMLLKTALKANKFKDKKLHKSSPLKNNLNLSINNLKISEKHSNLSKPDIHPKPNKTEEKIKNTIVNFKILNNLKTS